MHEYDNLLLLVFDCLGRWQARNKELQLYKCYTVDSYDFEGRDPSFILFFPFQFIYQFGQFGIFLN